MSQYAANHAARAGELRRRAADLQGDVERMQQQIAADLADALALECRSGAQPEAHSPKPTKEKP